MTWSSYPFAYKVFVPFSKLIPGAIYIGMMVTATVGILGNLVEPSSPLYSLPVDLGRITDLARANTTALLECTGCDFGALQSDVSLYCLVPHGNSSSSSLTQQFYSAPCIGQRLLNKTSSSSSILADMNTNFAMAKDILPSLSSVSTGNTVVASIQTAVHGLLSLQTVNAAWGDVTGCLGTQQYASRKLWTAHLTSAASALASVVLVHVTRSLRSAMPSSAPCSLASSFVRAELTVANNLDDAAAVAKMRDFACLGQWNDDASIGHAFNAAVLMIVMGVLDLVCHLGVYCRYADRAGGASGGGLWNLFN